jgi:hypothetical protein
VPSGIVKKREVYEQECKEIKMVEWLKRQEHLPSKFETLSSNPGTSEKKKKKK